MTDRNKFEEMLERLVNEDREGAEELFHEIVVEKSREIYENLLEDEEVEETTDEEVDEATDEEVDEATEDDLDESTDEEVDEATDEEVDEATDEEVDEATDEEVDESEEVEEATDEEVEEATDEEVEESTMPKSETEIMREYTDKVTASMGDNGANAKSPVAGKNDMGGTASNIVAGGEADTKGTGASSPKEDNAGNRNVPGGTSAKSGTKNEPGHGAEKKGKPEQAANTKPVIGG